MSAPKVNAKIFYTRLSKLYKAWEAGNKEGHPWDNVGHIICLAGSVDEDVLYSKTVALQSWLYGYEIPELLTVVTKEGVYMLASAKKAAMLQAVVDSDRPEDTTAVPIVVYTRNKADKDAENFAKIVEHIKSSTQQGNSGVVVKDLEKQPGKFATAFRDAITKADLTKRADISAGLADLFAVKDEAEIKLTQDAASLTNAVLEKYLVPQIETIIDQGKSMTHSKLSERTENQIGEPGKWNLKLDADYCDSCFPPIIQTGGKYDFKISAVSDEKSKIHPGTVICRFGARYKSYCSSVGRTYFINPTDHHKKAYTALQDVYTYLLSQLKPGAALNSVYEAVNKYIADKHPEYVDKVTKNFGFATGLEYREGRYAIDAKHSSVVRAGMTFALAIGFADLDNPEGMSSKSQTFAVYLGDTVEIQEDGEAKVLTTATANLDAISYALKDDDEGAAGNGDDKTKEESAEEKKKRTVLLEEKTRGEKAEDIARKHHQLELARKNRADAEARYTEQADQRAREANALLGRKTIGKISAYTSPARFPQGGEVTQIKVDMAKQCVLVPINNQLIPFHIRTIKRVHKDEQGDVTVLYLTFHTPTTGVNAMRFEDNNKVFIKELTFRAVDATNFNVVHRQINELRKQLSAAEKEKSEKASTVQQAPLQLSRQEKNPRLANVSLRPQISGRRSTGVLEAHLNGFRFTSDKGERVDILYKNIRNAFFQPAVKELHVLIHFHLWNPIMVGKKKQQDLQVFTEVVDASQDLDKAKRSGGYDFDELEAEEQERRMKKQLNTLFQNFAKKCEDVIERRSPEKVEFDMPYADLGFYGVPHKTTVHLQPTVNCLVELHEPPFFVLNLNDIEIVHLERVQFGNRNFDITFVKKDYSEPVVPVGMVPMKDLDAVKAWLDSCNLKYYEGTANLHWKQIMSTIRADPIAFHEDGGWNFLADHDENEEGGDGSGDEEEESEYEPDDDSSAEVEESDDDYSYDEEDDDESEYGEEELSEEGMDWSDLEEEAEQDDRKRKRYDDDTPKKKGGKKRR